MLVSRSSLPRHRVPCVAVYAIIVFAALAVVEATNKTEKELSKDDVRPLSAANGYDIAAMAFMGVGLALASAGGAGGGVIIVPVLIVAMGFDIKFATPTSNFIIMGGAVANAMFNLQKRHPFVDRPLVDADICMAMIPSMMGGAVIGAFLSKLLPSYVISVLLVLLMGVSGVRTMQKGMRLHKTELATMESKLEEQSHHQNQQQPVAQGAQDASPRSLQTSESTSSFHELRSPSVEIQVTDIAHASETKEMTSGEKPKSEQDSTAQPLVLSAFDRDHQVQLLLTAESHFNFKKHGLIVLCYAGILAATIGGAATKCGSAAYWTLLWLEIPWVLLFTGVFVVVMRRAQRHKRALDFPKTAGDLEWTNKTVMLFPMACLMAGVVAGLFGVGGAIITGPLMIEMGVLPEVASSSSALLVLYSSAAATAKFALFNMIAYDWAGVLCAMAFVVTSIAQVYIGGYVRRTGRQSIIIFCIGITICVGGVLMVYSTVRTIIDDAGDPFSVQFCPKATPSSSNGNA